MAELSSDTMNEEACAVRPMGCEENTSEVILGIAQAPAAAKAAKKEENAVATRAQFQFQTPDIHSFATDDRV